MLKNHVLVYNYIYEIRDSVKKKSSVRRKKQ